MNQYPALRFVIRYGGVLALAVAVVVLALGIVGVVMGGGWVSLVAGMIGAPLAWLGVKNFAELNTIIADMLLPR